MIVVTSATGKLGAAVVANLLGRVPASEIVASVRDPNEAGVLAARGVAARRGDYDQPDTLERAFAGAERLLLVAAPGINPAQRVAQHRNAIDAARRAGVGQVYYTSLAIREPSVTAVMQAHQETEAYLKASGLSYTILRNGIYLESWALYLGDLAADEVAIPADGPIVWVARQDLAEGTARLLAEGGHAGETLWLTGPAALDLAGMVAIARRVLERPLTVTLVPVDAYIQRQMAAGKPEARVRPWATTYAGLARGEFATVDPLLEDLLGRARQTVEDAFPPLLRAAQSHPQ